MGRKTTLMIVKTYGLFDGVAKEYVRTFTAKNDEVAQRSAKYIVREPNFDSIAGRDYIITHLFDFESSTGQVVDNDIRVICNLAQEIEIFEKEKKEMAKLAAKIARKKGVESDGKSSPKENGQGS